MSTRILPRRRTNTLCNSKDRDRHGSRKKEEDGGAAVSASTNIEASHSSVWVDYTAVTVRVTDFNGRPLAGAFVQLWDKASGKLAAWHYTAATRHGMR